MRVPIRGLLIDVIALAEGMTNRVHRRCLSGWFGLFGNCTTCAIVDSAALCCKPTDHLLSILIEQRTVSDVIRKWLCWNRCCIPTTCTLLLSSIYKIISKSLLFFDHAISLACIYLSTMYAHSASRPTCACGFTANKQFGVHVRPHVLEIIHRTLCAADWPTKPQKHALTGTSQGRWWICRGINMHFAQM